MLRDIVEVAGRVSLRYSQNDNRDVGRNIGELRLCEAKTIGQTRKSPPSTMAR